MRLTPARFFGFWATLFALVFALSSCSDDLDVQQSYPFTVEVMPFAEKIVKGQTVELRFEIQPEGNYTNTLYTIRYFQYDGEGTLKLVDGPVLVNNDRVLLESKTFRLNY
ncbi:TraQ conjugal transfer family protein, partial [uncultured Muribaculum sp.]|uniref:TraQ conjugal transfer family protein n=1 Tax=uncultured Muribaculum sp. TaxID=1918613 RepID=UPI0026665F59